MWTIIFLAIATVNWTTATVLRHGNYQLDIDDGTLRSVTPTNASDIDLSNLKLRKIDARVFDDFTQLQSLNLSFNELEQLPPLIFSKLEKLETLSLANNKLSRFDRNFIGLGGLKTLDISQNDLRFVRRGDFFGLPKTAEIIAENNDLSVISTALFVNPVLREPDDGDKHKQDGRQELSTTSTTTDAPPVLDENVRVKICVTPGGLVTKVEEFKESDTQTDDCKIAPVNHENRALYLRNRGLREFQRGWYKLQAFPFDVIDFTGNSIVEVTAELLNDLPAGLTFVNLANNSVQRLQKDVINNHNLKRINLNYNNIDNIEDSALENTKLTGLFLMDNRLRDLSFAKTLPPTLQQLVLENNRIGEVREGSLERLENLIFLDISGNLLEDSVPAGAFRNLRKLSTIDLSDNKLTKILPGTFDDLESVLTLNLKFNLITDVGPGALRGLKVLKFLELSGNKIKKIRGDSFTDLREKLGYHIFLDGNEIEAIERGGFANVPVLHLVLDNNKISRIERGAFDTPSLIELDMNNNLLTTIDGDSFEGLPELYRLSLRQNRVESIRKGAFKNLRELIELNLSENPIQRFENGAFFGFKKTRGTFITVEGTKIKVIEAGAFDDV